MLNASTETYVGWITWLLLLGFGLAALAGLVTLNQSRRMRYFQVRRDAVVRGWNLLLISVALLMGSGFAAGLGTPLLRLAVAPTATPPPPSATRPSATPPPSSTPTVTATGTDTPGPSPTATTTGTPTVSPTPVLPEAFISPVPGATVTPPEAAIAAEVRFTQRNDCTTANSSGFFDQLPKTVYAHFFYNNWLPGVQWSGVWLRDGAVVFVETRLWDGSTGGCGFTNFDNAKGWWEEGHYEVQIFVGAKWLVSGTFEVVRSTPTPTITPTRTPVPTVTPSPTRTPRTPTLTPTVTPTRTPRPATPTPSRTGTRPPTATWSPTATRTRTPQPTTARFPPGVYGLAVINVQNSARSVNLRESPPDGRVLAMLPGGTELQVLEFYQTINGVLWRQVRLDDGTVGWISAAFLTITETR